MQYENEQLEFKSKMTDSVYKEVVAFANTQGGVIYIGVDDNGNEVGIVDIDQTYTKVANGIRDAIAPDVTRFVHYVMQKNKVIRVEVSEGNYKPYYLKEKGLKPSGVYVRQGAESVMASTEQIRERIKDSDGDKFEQRRSTEQNLSFKERQSAFSKFGVPYSENKFIVLGLTNPNDGLYTNLALILSDQCPYSIKTAIFQDENNLQFQDAKEFKGSLFKQRDDCFEYLTLCNHTTSVINGLVRVDKRDYPLDAVREALRNSLVHRDYSFSGSIRVKINKKQMEFISLGGLMPNLSLEDIKTGISQPRNPILASLFHRLRLIEAYGTGIQKIFYLYKDCAEKPRIEVTPHVFKLILPNRNKVSETESSVSDTIKEKKDFITPQRKKVLEYLAIHQETNEGELQELLNIKKTRAYLLARQMVTEGLIVSSGRGANKKYRLK